MPSSAKADAANTTPLRVIVVDDDPDIALLLKHKLQAESPDFEITTHTSGEDCLSHLAEHPADCILSDFQMPGMNGMELLTSLRGSGNDIPFIFVTGQGNEEVATEAFRNGAFDYFTKDLGFAYFTKITNSILKAVEQRRNSRAKALMEEALEKAAFGVSGFTGGEFFRSLVKYLASTLGVDYAFVGELVLPEANFIRTRAVFAHGGFAPDMDYMLEGTPCENVVGSGLCCYSTGVQGLFPKDKLLHDMGVDSYVGTPLFDSSGRPLGILVVLHSDALENIELARSLLQLFAGRAAAELERIRTEIELIKSEQKYRTLMDNASDAIFLADPGTGIILDVNGKASTLMGLPEKDLIGRHQSELHPPEDRERYVQIFREHLEGGGSTPIEAEIIKDSGARVPVEITSSVIEIEGKQILQGIFRDITERLNSERALIESESRFRALVEKANVGVIVVRDGLLDYANPCMLNLFGYGPDEVRGRGFLDFVYDEDRDYVASKVMEVMSGTETEPIELRALKKDGGVAVLESNAVKADVSGADVMIATAVDITARKRMNEDLLSREKFLSDIFSSMRDGICVLDREFTIKRVNPTLEKWYEDAMPLVGKQCFRAFKGQVAPCELCPTREALLTNRPVTNVVPKKSGPDEAAEWMEVYSFPLIDSETGETTGVVEHMRDITDAKKNESTALALGRILEESLNEIYIYDAETLRFTQVNRGARENLGYSLDEMKLLTPLDFKPELNQGSLDELLAPLRRGERERVELSTVHRRADGSLYPVEVHVQMSAYGGRPVFAETARDITRRIRAEKKLRQANELLAAITDAQGKFLTETDTAGLYEGMLHYLLKLTNSEYGFIGEVRRGSDGSRYLVTRFLSNIAWDDDTRRFYEEHASNGMEFKQLDNLFGEVLTTEKPVISNDPANDPRSAGLPAGHPPISSFLGLPVFSGSRFVGVAGIANRPSGYDRRLVDRLMPFISTCGNIIEADRAARERAEMEDAIKRSESGLRSIIEALPDMVMVLGRDGAILDVKYYDERVFSDMREDGTPYIISEILPEEVADASKEHLEDVFGNGGMRTFDYTLLLPQGERHYEARLVRSGDDVAVAIVRDMTENRELDRQKADMLAMVRHDVKTPLSLILGYTDVILTEHARELDPEVVSMTESIQKNTRYISHMLDDIVDIFKLEAGNIFLKMSRAAPSEIVIEARINASGMAKQAGIELVRSIEEGLPDIDVDRSYIQRALMNLAFNALTFTQSGGKVTIGAKRLSEDGREYVALFVEDNGPGISPEEHEKVFERYYRSPSARSVKGSGLGLAIVKAVAEAHEGRVTLASEPGRGSTFSLLIPVHVDTRA